MEILSKLTNPLFIIQHWSAAMATTVSKGIGSMAVVTGAIWIGTQLFLKFLGNLFFLERWGRKRSVEIKTKIFQACNESQI